MTTTPDTLELVLAIVEAMVDEFDISRDEAVARVNRQWRNMDLSVSDELVLHEDERFWSLWIYYGGVVPDWRPDADRSTWIPLPPPDQESGVWPR